MDHDDAPQLYIDALMKDAARNGAAPLMDECEPFNDARIFALGVSNLDHLKQIAGAMGLSPAWTVSHVIGDLDFNPWVYGTHDSAKLAVGFIVGKFLDRDFASTLRREARMMGMAAHVATAVFGDGGFDIDKLFSDAVTGALSDAFDGRMHDDPRNG